MSLTDTAIRGIKPADKAWKFFDGNGLFLYVAPSGTKSWRVKSRFQGREKLAYPWHIPPTVPQGGMIGKQ